VQSDEKSNKLRILIDDFHKLNKGKVIYVSLSGSKLYGTDNPNSDIDYKGIFIPSKESLLLKNDIDVYTADTNNTKEKNTKDDIDFTLYSIHKFFNLLVKAETGSIDLLFSIFRDDTIVYKTNEYKIIKDNYLDFLNKDMKSFTGYALGQAKRYGIKGAKYKELSVFMDTVLPFLKEDEDKLLKEYKSFIKETIKDFKYTKYIMAPGPRSAKTKGDIMYLSIFGKMFDLNTKVKYFIERIEHMYSQFGNRTKTIAETEDKVDYKALSHALRIVMELEELINTKFIKFPLQYKDKIKEVKEGKVNSIEVIQKVQDTIDAVDELILSSDFPEEINKDKIRKIILDFYN